MSTPILQTGTKEQFDAAVTRAVELLRAGEVVALPTETVYGLAANALDPQAVARIFQVKGRPAHNPIIVHIAGTEMARKCVAQWPEMAERLAAAFWPGPLTMVLPRAQHIPDIVTAGGNTVGVRWPNHPVMQTVIAGCGFPLAAPSANLSSQMSPTTAEHVASGLGGRIPLIVDGGATYVGIESTVLDLSMDPPRVLRPGMVQADAIRAVTGELAVGGAGGTHLKSPGLLEKHYAPRARLSILVWESDVGLADIIQKWGMRPERVHVLAYRQAPGLSGLGGVTLMPREPVAYARLLYATLHRCDAEGAGWIVVEALPEQPEWQAVADRLRRAAA